VPQSPVAAADVSCCRCCCCCCCGGSCMYGNLMCAHTTCLPAPALFLLKFAVNNTHMHMHPLTGGGTGTPAQPLHPGCLCGQPPELHGACVDYVLQTTQHRGVVQGVSMRTCSWASCVGQGRGVYVTVALPVSVVVPVHLPTLHARRLAAGWFSPPAPHSSSSASSSPLPCDASVMHVWRPHMHVSTCTRRIYTATSAASSASAGHIQSVSSAASV
jgi:hypothetical protein